MPTTNTLIQHLSITHRNTFGIGFAFLGFVLLSQLKPNTASAAYFVNVIPTASATAQYTEKYLNNDPYTTAGPASSQAVNSGVSLGTRALVYVSATNTLTTTDTSLSATVAANTGWGSFYSFPPADYAMSASSSLGVTFQVTTSGLYNILGDRASESSSYEVQHASWILTITDLTNPGTQLQWGEFKPLTYQLLSTDTYQLTLNAATNITPFGENLTIPVPTGESAFITVTAVPEPASLAILGCTLFTFTSRRRNRK